MKLNLACGARKRKRVGLFKIKYIGSSDNSKKSLIYVLQEEITDWRLKGGLKEVKDY